MQIDDIPKNEKNEKNREPQQRNRQINQKHNFKKSDYEKKTKAERDIKTFYKAPTVPRIIFNHFEKMQ